MDEYSRSGERLRRAKVIQSENEKEAYRRTALERFSCPCEPDRVWECRFH